MNEFPYQEVHPMGGTDGEPELKDSVETKDANKEVKMLITDELYEQVEMIVQDGGNRITIRQRNRTRVLDDWSDWKPPILNRREVLGVYQAISDIVLQGVK